MPRMTKAQIADLAADAVALSKEHADRAGGMTPAPGQFAVTIRIDRPDGQFVTSTRLVPDDLTPDDPPLWYLAAGKIAAQFVSAYERAAELPG